MFQFISFDFVHPAYLYLFVGVLGYGIYNPFSTFFVGSTYLTFAFFVSFVYSLSFDGCRN